MPLENAYSTAGKADVFGFDCSEQECSTLTVRARVTVNTVAAP